MNLFVLLMVVALNGQIHIAMHSEDRKTPYLFKDKEACEEGLKNAKEVLDPQMKELGAEYQMECITAEQANEMLGKEGV